MTDHIQSEYMCDYLKSINISFSQASQTPGASCEVSFDDLEKHFGGNQFTKMLHKYHYSRGRKRYIEIENFIRFLKNVKESSTGGFARFIDAQLRLGIVRIAGSGLPMPNDAGKVIYSGTQYSWYFANLIKEKYGNYVKIRYEYKMPGTDFKWDVVFDLVHNNSECETSCGNIGVVMEIQDRSHDERNHLDQCKKTVAIFNGWNTLYYDYRKVHHDSESNPINSKFQTYLKLDQIINQGLLKSNQRYRKQYIKEQFKRRVDVSSDESFIDIILLLQENSINTEYNGSKQTNMLEFSLILPYLRISSVDQITAINSEIEMILTKKDGNLFDIKEERDFRIDKSKNVFVTWNTLIRVINWLCNKSYIDLNYSDLCINYLLVAQTVYEDIIHQINLYEASKYRGFNCNFADAIQREVRKQIASSEKKIKMLEDKNDKLHLDVKKCHCVIRQIVKQYNLETPDILKKTVPIDLEIQVVEGKSIFKNKEDFPVVHVNDDTKFMKIEDLKEILEDYRIAKKSIDKAIKDIIQEWGKGGTLAENKYIFRMKKIEESEQDLFDQEDKREPMDYEETDQGSSAKVSDFDLTSF